MVLLITDRRIREEPDGSAWCELKIAMVPKLDTEYLYKKWGTWVNVSFETYRDTPIAWHMLK